MTYYAPDEPRRDSFHLKLTRAMTTKVKSNLERDTTTDIDVNLDPLARPSLENLARGLSQPVEYQHNDLSTDDSLESIGSNKEPLVEIELEKKDKFFDLEDLIIEELEKIKLKRKEKFCGIKLERKEKFCDISILLFKDHLQSQLTDDIQALHRPSSSSNKKPTLEHCNLHDPGFYTPSVEIASTNSQIDCPRNICSSMSEIDKPLHLTPIVIKPDLKRHQVDTNKSEERLVKVTKLTKKGRKQKDVIQDDPIRNLTVIPETPLSRSSLFGKIDVQGEDQLPLPRDFHPAENTTGACSTTI